MKIAAVTGRNAVIERSTAAIAQDGSALASHAPRKRTCLWTTPVTFSALQDSGGTNYQPLDADTLNGYVVCSDGVTAMADYDRVYKTDGVPDENGDYTFTKIADITVGQFSTLPQTLGRQFRSVKCLDDGSWLLVFDTYLFRSTDLGETWVQVRAKDTTIVHGFGWHGVDGAHIVISDYANDMYSTHVSHDYGATWETVFTDEPSVPELGVETPGTNHHRHMVIWDPTSNHTAAFVSRGDGVANAVVYRIFDNGGATWELDTDFLYHDAGFAVAGVTLSGTDPVVITCTGHCVNTGDKVRFYGLGGTTGLNFTASPVTYTVTYVNANSFSLQGTNSSNFSAWTSGGVFRIVPVGPGWLLGYAQPCAAVATDDAIYFATEASFGPTVMKLDLATHAITATLFLRANDTSWYKMGTSKLVHFNFRKIGGLYYLSCMTDTTHMQGEIYVSPDLEHWACIRNVTIAGSGSFFGYHAICGPVNGKLFAGVRDALTTARGEVFAAPLYAVSEGVTCETADTNLLSPAVGHMNDNASFETASHDWTDSSGSVTLARSTEKAWAGSYSLKCTNGAAGLGSYQVHTPTVWATLGYQPQANDILVCRAKLYIPEAYRNVGAGVRISHTLSGAASGKTTAWYNATGQHFFYKDGWMDIVSHSKITSSYVAGDDIKFSVSLYNLPAGLYCYLDACEILVRTARLEYEKPYDEGVAASEYAVVPMAGAGTDWTATFNWRPSVGGAKGIISGTVPLCRVVMSDGDFVDLAWQGAAGADRGKFLLTRTLAGSAQTTIKSTEQYEPFFEDVVSVAIGSDSANDKVKVRIWTPTAAIAIEDADTGLTQPAHMLLGTNHGTPSGGCGVFNAAQVFDTEFVAVEASVLAQLVNLSPKLPYRVKPGIILPI